MTAIDDIRTAIERTILLAEAELGQPLSPAANRFARAERLRVKVGRSAAQALVAANATENDDARLPETISDVPVIRTDEFAGFEVVIL